MNPTFTTEQVKQNFTVYGEPGDQNQQPGATREQNFTIYGAGGDQGSANPSAVNHRVLDAIDTAPLTGKARTEFEKSLRVKYKLKARTWHLLDVLLTRFHWGKADSYPSIAGLMGWLPGWSESTVRRHLHALRKANVVRLFSDHSVISQRRIVLIDHPHGQTIIDALVGNANVREMLPTAALRGVKNECIQGCQKAAPRGVKTSAPRGVRALTPEPLTVEDEILKPLNGKEISTPNGERLATDPAPGTAEWILALAEKSAENPGRLARRVTPLTVATVAPIAPECPQTRPRPEVNTQGLPQPQAPQKPNTAVAFSWEDERAMMDALRAIGPGSTDQECRLAALTLTMRLHDEGSTRFWYSVVNDVRLGKIPESCFLGVADGKVRDPRRVIVARVKKARGPRP